MSDDVGGQPLEYAEEQNPAKMKRNRTNLFCLVLFVAAWIATIAIGGVGLSKGDPQRFTKGYMLYQGKAANSAYTVTDLEPKMMVCGKGDLENYPYVYFPSPAILAMKVSSSMLGLQTGQTLSFSGVRKSAVCVDRCPQAGSWATATCASGSTSCFKVPYLGSSPKLTAANVYKYQKPIDNDSTWSSLSSGARELFNTKSKFNRCVPNFSNSTTPAWLATGTQLNVGSGTFTAVKNGFISAVVNGPGAVLKEFMQRAMDNIGAVVGGIVMAIVFGFVWIWMLRFIAKPIIYSTLFLATAFTLGVGIVYLAKAGVIKTDSVPGAPSGASESDASKADRSLAYAIGSICTAVGVFLLVTTIVMMKRIKFALQIINQASRCIGDMKKIVFYPFVTFGFYSCVIVWCLIVAIFLASAKSVTVDKTIAETDCATRFGTSYEYCVLRLQTTFDDTLQKMAWFTLFMLIWGIWFFDAMNILVISGAVGQWYFTADKATLDRPIRTSFNIAWKYHSGSAAFGSLLIAIVVMTRIVFNYFVQTANKYKDNKIAKAVICCVNCCLACLQRFLEFINKHAYIQVALAGKGFIRSAKNATQLLFRNALRVVAVSAISSIFIFLGKIVIAFGAALIAAMITVGGTDGLGGADVITVLIVLFCGYMIASAFMNIYGITMDTLFQCFCMDSEMNKGRRMMAGAEFSSFMDDAEKSSS